MYRGYKIWLFYLKYYFSYKSKNIFAINKKFDYDLRNYFDLNDKEGSEKIFSNKNIVYSPNV